MKSLLVLVSLCLLLLFPMCFAKGISARAAGHSLSATASRVFAASSTQSSVTFNYTVTLDTTMGIIVIGLFDDMPITAGNFKNLTEQGVYDGTTFSRVAYGFVIQGGDATIKGIIVPPIPDELPNKHSNIRGSVAMAKTSQPNSATSQFYINLVNNTYLDSNYSVFGQVIQGMDVVDAIGNVPTNPPNDGAPVQKITILKATLSLTVSEYILIVLLPLFMITTLLTVALHKGRQSVFS
jgi:peptidylprolyl isomerase